MAMYNVSGSEGFSFLLDRNFKACLLEKKDILYKGGIPFAERNCSTNVFPIFMIQVILSFLLSRFFYFILRPLKQPKTVCNLLSGIVLGPSVLGRNKKLWDKLFPTEEMIMINSTSLIGIIYIFFVIGVKIDTVMTINMAKSVWKISLTILMIPFIITMILTSLLIGHMPGLTPGPFIYFFSIILTSSYFSSTAHAIGDLNLVNSELGRLALACAIFHELLGWCNMALGIFLSGDGKYMVIKAEVCLCAVLLFVFFVARPAVMMIIRRTPEGKPVNKEYIIGLLILTLLVSVMSDLLGSSYITGALIMGLIIPAGPPLGSALVEKSEVIISDIFLPFFYIRMGQNINIATITNWQQFFVLESILVTAYLTKILASILAFIVFRKSLRDSVLFGFILNFKGMPDYVLIAGWRMHQLVDEEVLTTLLLSHLMVTAISAPIIDIFYKPERRLMWTGSSTEHRMMKPLQGMPLEMELRILFCINNEDNVNSLITLFKAWNPTEMSPICAYAVHLMELAGRAVPLLVPYNNHRFKLNSNSTDRIMRSLTKFTKKSSFSVTIQPFTMIAPYQTMHESICNLVRDKYIPLVIIPFHESQQEDTKTPIFRNLNINIQAYAPCTVGIFVDRGLPHHLTSRPFSYNVVVFFLGGPDDREAMAFVSRMSGQPGFFITVFLIDFKGDYLIENELEKDLDNTAVKEFRARNFNTASVMFHEIEAYDSVQVMRAIISIEDKYDLVVVGKRRVANSILEKEMEPWIEQKELGILGDLIASSDFHRGLTSVLVMQSAVTVLERVKSAVITSSEGPSGFSTSTGDDGYYGRIFGRASERVLEKLFGRASERVLERLCTKV